MLKISSIDNFYNNPRFCAKSDDDKKHISTGQVATATGATAASTNTYKIVKSYTSKTASALKKTNQAAKEVNTAFSGLKLNAVKIKNQIIRWGEGFKNSRFLKPLFTNRLFKAAASGIGSVMAILIFISGIGDMFNSLAAGLDKYRR